MKIAKKKMVIAIIVISVFATIVPNTSATQVDMDGTALKLRDIQETINEKGANWTAGETSVSGLSVEEKKMLCGAKIGSIPEDAVVLSPPEVSYGTFDWRNVNGQDWVTSVKNQGYCGSCWIFGSTAAFETQINIDANDPTIDFNASEQNILSCSGGGDCDGGWPDLALVSIRDTGVPDEACLPYQADDTVPCSDTCPDWQNRAWTCEDIGVPTYHTTDTYKAILENYGPMVVVLNVSEDLFHYTGGIYEPVWTSEEFGWADHCVMLVGYDEPNGCWIIKNSWSPGWGENGYGRVYYGNIEQYEYAFVVLNTTAFAANNTVVKVEPGSQTVLSGQGFSVNVTVDVVTDMAADGAILHFDPTAMQATDITPEVINTFPVEITDNTTGTVTFAYALSAGSFNGNGTLATIEFTTNASAEGTFNLNLTGVELLRSDHSVIPTEVFNGTVTLIPFNITITSPENRTYASICVRLNFTVEPEGTTLDWVGYSLDGGANVTIAGNITIGGVSEGSHNITVFANDTHGNMAASNTVYFTLHPADIDFSGRVYLSDLLLLAHAYNSKPGDGNWNPDADLNCDDRVYTADLLILARNYDKEY